MVGDDARTEQIILKVLTLEAHEVMQDLLVEMLVRAPLESRAGDFVRQPSLAGLVDPATAGDLHFVNHLFSREQPRLRRVRLVLIRLHVPSVTGWHRLTILANHVLS